MKAKFQRFFSPILTVFESGNDPIAYKPMHRTILIVVGGLFVLLATSILVLGVQGEGFGFLLPFLVFGGVGTVCLIVGLLGSDRAVAKIWGTRKR